MAKTAFEELYNEESIDLTDKFILVETKHDGYTSTKLGSYVFAIQTETKEAEGEDEGATTEYKVFGTYLRDDNVFVNEKYPVLFTDGDQVIFSVNTVSDPYSFAYPEIAEVKEGQTKEHAVLQAFQGFAHDRFQLAKYHIMMADTPALQDDDTPEVPFEWIDEFERDVIHPWAGKHDRRLPE